MKAIALILALLFAVPAGAATVWVSPVRGTSLDSTTYSGADSTDANARSLAWFNARAKPGDVCLMKSGTYPSPIRPVNNGGAGNLITYAGDLAQPFSRSVTAVDFDSSAGNVSGWRYISVKGVGSPGSLTISVTNNTACYDSILNCIFSGGYDLAGSSSATVRYCRIGTGDITDKSNLAQGNSANPYQFISGVAFLDNTLNLATESGSNAMWVRWCKSGEYARNRHVLKKRNTATRDSHLSTWYNVQDMNVHDNYFAGWAEGMDAAYYILNTRDNQVANRWVRDTFVEIEGSPRPLKVGFSTSGQYPGTSHNNLWDSNYANVEGWVEYQNGAVGDIHRGNVYVTGDPAWLSNTSAPTDSLTFTHNTIATFGQGGATVNGYLTNARVTQNIFYAARLNSTNCHGYVGYNKASAGTTLGLPPTGTIDSNLVYCAVGADSMRTVNLENEGGCTRSPLTGGRWGSVYGFDLASHWLTPQFTDTLGRATFNPQPVTGSLALSASLWADGYAGARPSTADVTDPVVTIAAPVYGRQWRAGDYMFIDWSSTDAVGVTHVDIDYAKITAPDTWLTIAHGAGGTSNYTWRVPNITASLATMRFRAYDAAGNVGEATVDFLVQCLPCEDTDPYFDPFGWP